MEIRRLLILAGMVAVLALLVPASQVMAGSGIEPPPEGATITGPEVWGVVVIDCTPPLPDSATVRVKRIVNCNVETQAIAEQDWQLGCPPDKSAVENQSLVVGTTFFDIPGTPFINKAKYFEINGTVVSFEAQFKFWLPGP